MEKKYTFSQRLRELLQIFNIKQTELSIKTGISKSSISHYLKGDWEGKQDAVYKIASAFGISEAWLMGVDVPLYPAPPTVYDRIRILREKNGLSQQELANRVGFKTASAINKIELGLRDISQTKLSEFAKALDTTPGYLMGWENNVSPAPAASDVLTEKEQHLLTGFRDLNELGQEAVLTTLDGFTHNPVYKKCPAPTLDKKQA